MVIVIRIPFYCFFFFSSRRRHTRFSRDWSSDVCSSDLQRAGAVELFGGQVREHIDHRQMEMLDRKQRRVVERDQGPTLAHERAQGLRPGLPDAVGVLARKDRKSVV